MPKIDFGTAALSDASKNLESRQRPPKFFSVQIANARRFHLQLRPAPGKRLSVVSGGVERCAPDYQIRRNTFPFLAFEFVAGGSGTLELAAQRCRLVPGTLFSYGPRISHYIVTDPREPLVKYFVDFGGTDALRLLRAAGLPPGTAAQTAAPAEVMPIFDEIIRNGEKNTPHSVEICGVLLEALLLKLGETRVPVGSVESAAFETYQNCRRLLHERAMRINSLEELAEQCGIDPAYLCRLFRRFDQQSPYNQLMRVKMSHAAARLQSPGTLVKQVAAELGFSDPYHFSRSFKRVFGLSPTKLVRER